MVVYSASYFEQNSFVFFIALKLGFALPPSHLFTVENATSSLLAKLCYVKNHFLIF